MDPLSMARKKSQQDARTWQDTLKGEARRFHEEEEGATLVFAAATFFALAMSIMFVLQIGFISSDRLQMQGAADSAAYSGALVEANSLNAIGQINDGITYVNYIAMRHAIDGVVYASTLRQYTSWYGNWREPTADADGGKHGYVIMGGDEDEGNKRIKHIVNHYDPSEAPRGKRGRLHETLDWRRELYFAARLIMRATPSLVKTTASEVAAANGASHVGFSDDLEKAWELGEGETDGFSDRAYTSDEDDYSPSMYERYEGRKVVQLDVVASNTAKASERKLPRGDSEKWYNHQQGKFLGDDASGGGGYYYQVRLCWRKEDWDHGEKTKSNHSTSPFNRYEIGVAPNAHWHHGHTHYGTDPVYGFPVPALGHVEADPRKFLDEGGHQDEARDIHEATSSPFFPLHQSDPWKPIAHHAVRDCRNCFPGHTRSKYWPNPSTKGKSKYSQIMASAELRPGSIKSLNADLNRKVNYFGDSLGERLIGPIALREPILRSGLTVATWERSRGIGRLLPESPWGMIAIASAQIGIETPNGVTPLESLKDGQAQYAGGPAVPYWDKDGGSGQNSRDSKTNLFYDLPGGRDGFHFSARLVPVAARLTWQKSNENGDGIKSLLEGPPEDLRWYRAGKITRRTPSQKPPIGALTSDEGGFLQARTREDLEAFWH